MRKKLSFVQTSIERVVHIKKIIYSLMTAMLVFAIIPSPAYAMKVLEPSKEIAAAPVLEKVTYNYKTKKVYVTVKGESWTDFRAKLKGSKKSRYQSNGSVGVRSVTFAFKIKASKAIILQKKPEQNLYWGKELVVKRSQYVTKKPVMKREWRTETDDRGYVYAYGKGTAPKNAYVKVYYKGKVVKKIKTKSGKFRYKVKVKFQFGKHLKVSAKVKNKKRSWPIKARDLDKQVFLISES
ncbi:hypothetical protein HMPREF0556_10253 [Listeria grayi DSM 20601]|uniref:Uncharacterized protein n=1 Tax=Listeria grayi DSM 20601 TaxID=525367 RepID=D7UUX8_LISGR|nr:hypothetical protein HMPREF0556_10253 [Listeria grayi DSM 20601]